MSQSWCSSSLKFYDSIMRDTSSWLIPPSKSDSSLSDWFSRLGDLLIDFEKETAGYFASLAGWSSGVFACSYGGRVICGLRNSNLLLPWLKWTDTLSVYLYSESFNLNALAVFSWWTRLNLGIANFWYTGPVAFSFSAEMNWCFNTASFCWNGLPISSF